MPHRTRFARSLPHIRILRTGVVLLAFIALVAGCASKQTKEQTEQEIYAGAKKNIDKGNFITAQTDLQDLETRFPFGHYYEQSQLDMLYAQMRALDYPGVVATAERFLRQNPSHPSGDYVLYMRGLANSWLQSGLFERRSTMNPALRDLGNYRDAYDDFAELVQKFPDSPYAPDARSRMLELRNRLAEQEMVVAWYYTRRGACVGAIERAQYVLMNYPTSPQLSDALAVSSECYRRLGEQTVADRYLATLKANDPKYRRLRSDGSLDVPEGRNADGPSWWHILSFGILP